MHHALVMKVIKVKVIKVIKDSGGGGRPKT